MIKKAVYDNQCYQNLYDIKKKYNSVWLTVVKMLLHGFVARSRKLFVF